MAITRLRSRGALATLAFVALTACEPGPGAGLRAGESQSALPTVLPVPVTSAPATPSGSPEPATPSATRSAPPRATTSPPPVRPAGRDPKQRYRVTVEILESPEHGPELCVGGVMQSLPPQCGGVPVTPFSWRDVPNRESRGGTTWGTATLVGTFDGRTFHLTEKPGPPRTPAATADTFEPGCPTPAGGWRTVDDGKTSEADANAVTEYANGEPDVAAVWLSWLRPPGEGSSYTDAVLNLAFTGDLDRHRREARALWGGALCVTRLPRARAELLRVQARLDPKSDEARRAGVYLWGSNVDEIRNVVVARVLIADGVTQRWLDEEFGPGLVEGEGIFQPVG